MKPIDMLGLMILESIKTLKATPMPLCAEQTLERYDIDGEFDVRLTVQLIPKKSQRERGLEMLGVPHDD